MAAYAGRAWSVRPEQGARRLRPYVAQWRNHWRRNNHRRVLQPCRGRRPRQDAPDNRRPTHPWSDDTDPALRAWDASRAGRHPWRVGQGWWVLVVVASRPVDLQRPGAARAADLRHARGADARAHGARGVGPLGRAGRWARGAASGRYGGRLGGAGVRAVPNGGGAAGQVCVPRAAATAPRAPVDGVAEDERRLRRSPPRDR